MIPVSTNFLVALSDSALISVETGSVLALLLLLKSIKDFTHSGPQLKTEIRKYYWHYTMWAVVRLAWWAIILLSLMGLAGNLVYLSLAVLGSQPFFASFSIAAALVGIAVVTSLQFLHRLLYLPASLMASSHYNIKRLYPAWSMLTPLRIRMLIICVAGTAGLVLVLAMLQLAAHGDLASASALLLVVVTLMLVLIAANWRVKAEPPQMRATRQGRPNILMIGSDTLRADRLGGNGYVRALTPFLDQLAGGGTVFKNCFVPCARTAPSLLSMLTGTWPHRHGVRDNFVLPEEFDASLPRLPHILAAHGYRTCAIGDWCAADLGKFDLGFQDVDLPFDQWNVKYLVRQGPKDLRLFLTLFTHGQLGKLLLPELYYLAGVPLSRDMVETAKSKLNQLAESNEPFLLNVFMATTHPPFGSEYPYYLKYADRHYQEGSKFVMEKLNDPFEIIRRQGDARAEFDLDQIVNLYDGCVTSFDDKVRELVTHVEQCGLRENTIIVIYSDHGMEFFEHDTWGQGNSVLGDFSSRIPLIIIDPHAPQGTVVEEVVRSIDIAPTLLELAGISPDAAIQGRSLCAAMRTGQSGGEETPALMETGIWLARVPGLHDDHLLYPNIMELLEVPDKKKGTLAIRPEYCNQVVRAKDRAIRTARWKLVYQPLTKGYLLRLYDVQADPECRRDVTIEQPEVTAGLWEQLQAWLAADSTGCLPLYKNDTMGCDSSRSWAAR